MSLFKGLLGRNQPCHPSVTNVISVVSTEVTMFSRLKLRFVCLLLSIVPTGCAPDHIPSANSPDPTLNALFDCLTTAERQYDDRISAETVIAARIQPICHPQFVVYAAQIHPPASGDFEAAKAKFETSLAVFIVSAVRSHKR